MGTFGPLPNALQCFLTDDLSGTILDALHRLANREPVASTRAEARDVMARGPHRKMRAVTAQIAALLTALKMKGETVEEIVGFAEAIRAAAAPLPIERPTTFDAIAVTGTGQHDASR